MMKSASQLFIAVFKRFAECNSPDQDGPLTTDGWVQLLIAEIGHLRSRQLGWSAILGSAILSISLFFSGVLIGREDVTDDYRNTVNIIVGIIDGVLCIILLTIVLRAQNKIDQLRGLMKDIINGEENSNTARRKRYSKI